MSVAANMLLLAGPLLGLSALVVDVAWMGICRNQLDSAADSAALAAVAHLDDPGTAESVASSYLAAHSVGGGAPFLGPSGFEIGSWDGTTFTAAANGDSVRVTAQVAGRQTILAGILGMGSFDVTAASVAKRNSGTVCGLVALNKFELNGNAEIWGYNSSTGMTVTNGAVCSNSTSVKLEGDIAVHGDVRPGPGGTVTLKDDSWMSGSSEPLDDVLPTPSLSYPGGCKPLPASVSGSYILTGGTYCRTGSFSITGTVTVTNPTTVVIKNGSLDIGGNGFVNLSGDPHDLTIEVIGSESVHVVGSSVFYGSLVAPDCEIELNNNADLYGAVVGEYVHVNGNMEVYIDVTLQAAIPTSGSGSLLVN